jgi:hypothetical protein
MTDFLVRLWHDSLHELIKQGHGKGGISMTGAPNHSFRDQVVSDRTERSNGLAQFLRNVPRTMGACPQFRHGPEICLLARCQAIETHSKETLIKGGNGCNRSDIDIGRDDKGLLRDVPGVFPSFL